MTGTVIAHPANQDRPLPSNETAEQALLGAILSRPDCIEDVADFVRPEHFFFAGHGRIYEAARAIHRHGRQFDPIAIMQATQNDEDVESVGGKDYIAGLLTGPALASNVRDYGEMIVDAHLRRELISAGQEITAGAYRGDIERPGTDQADDAIRRLTAIADDAALPTAGPQPIGRAVSATIDQLAAVVAAQGQVIGAPTGLHDLDRLLGGLQAPDLVILAGRPGMGKTALGLQIARHVAETHGPVSFYSLEMSEEQLVKRLIAAPTGISAERQRAGPLTSADLIALQEAAQNLGQLPLLLDQGRDRKVATIRAHARRLKRERGLSLLVIDYLQLLITGADNRWAELSQLTRDLKLMCKDVGIPALVLSQLSREVERRPDKRPTLSDLREGGSIEQDADSILFQYRDEYYLRQPQRGENESELQHLEKMETYKSRLAQVRGTAEIIVGKNRHGRTATVECRFDPALQRFTDLATQEAML